MAAFQSFDVVIVGGGTAGLVLANRLSEDPKLQVVVLEAGANHNDDPKIRIPALLLETQKNPEFDWDYSTVPQEHLSDRVVSHPRGRVLGGTSAINAMVVQYPGKRMFDAWQELGNNAWGWNTMKEYYKKFQTLHTPGKELTKALVMDDYANFELYGRDGPIQTSFAKYLMPMHKVWPETLQHLGYRAKVDPISGETSGAYTTPSFMGPDAARSHAGTAYWEPIESRPNVHLIERALVEKVLLSKSENGSITATAVQYTTKGERHIVNSRKEVIVCGGAFNSPALLELSGIGKASLLKSLKVETFIDNPFVGENLQDHPQCSISLEINDEKHTLDAKFRDPNVLKEAMREYNMSQSGILAMGFNCMACLPVIDLVCNSSGRKTLNDLLAQHLHNKYVSSLSTGQQLQIKHLQSILKDPNDSTAFISGVPLDIFRLLSSQGYNTISLHAALVHPFSRGTCHIASSDPMAKPTVDPKYFSNPIDMEIFARHMMQLGLIASTAPMSETLKSHGAAFPSNAPFETLDEAKDYITKTAVSQYHPCGTCAMMSQELGGVVDERCKVYGTMNLRVVDASIFPIIPKGPFTSTVYALAERAADLIKEDLART